MDPTDDTLAEKNQSQETEESYQEIDFKKEELNLLTCPRCNHIIDSKDINMEKLMAKCSNCQNVFSFSYDSATSSLVTENVIPKGIEELKLRSELELRLNWAETISEGGRWFMILFTGLWNLILLPFVVGVILSGQWGILIFLAAHLFIGLGLLWNLATIYFNQTYISVTKEEIKVTTKPLWHPFWRDKHIDTNTVTQLYVSQYVQSSKNGIPNYAYALYAILDSGEKVSLVRGMNRETQSYLERSMEEYLGIKNIKVPDEVGG